MNKKLHQSKCYGHVKDITITGTENGYVVLKMGSGKYHFESSK